MPLSVVFKVRDRGMAILTSLLPASLLHWESGSVALEGSLVGCWAQPELRAALKALQARAGKAGLVRLGGALRLLERAGESRLEEGRPGNGTG
ncbi:hypothetical protein H632_c5419p0, partial [Helicosporidium sp. ATCC 50920]